MVRNSNLEKNFNFVFFSKKKSVTFRIENFTYFWYNQCRESVTFKYGFKLWSGSADPYHWLTAPDPDSAPYPDLALFVSGFQDEKKSFFLGFWLLLLEDTFHQSSKKKKRKEVANSRNQGFSNFLHDDGRVRIRTVYDVSGSGSGRPQIYGSCGSGSTPLAIPICFLDDVWTFHKIG